MSDIAPKRADQNIHEGKLHPAGRLTYPRTGGLELPAIALRLNRNLDGVPDQSLVRHILGLLRRAARRAGVGPRNTFTAAAPRRARLQGIAAKLEAILAELDELGMQRAAIDVCMALDRVRAHIADCKPASESADPDR